MQYCNEQMPSEGREKSNRKEVYRPEGDLG